MEMAAGSLLEVAERRRRTTVGKLDRKQQAEMGQFFTPSSVAALMADMFGRSSKNVRLLDPGAGIGSLTAAMLQRLLNEKRTPELVEATAIEAEPSLLPLLSQVHADCAEAAKRQQTRFVGDARRADFITTAVNWIQGAEWGGAPAERFNRIILNPPYRKIRSDSDERRQLRSVGIETSNLYSAFVALCVKLLEPAGEMVAITPRSFCNGPYFKSFRRMLMNDCALMHVHLFEARNEAFKDDSVLQENVVYHVKKRKQPYKTVKVSVSQSGNGPTISTHSVSSASVVNPVDSDKIIHLVTSAKEAATAETIGALPCSLATLGVEVSTGRVVDFRAKTSLRADPGKDTVPLIYPMHVNTGRLIWPQPGGRKANAIVERPETSDLLVPSGNYVLVRRFSSKEERRRIYASLVEVGELPADKVGIENHLNYFHAGGRGLEPALARGLAVFLNTTVIDSFFRQFSGHTQVNATDLRILRFPAAEQLEKLGRAVGGSIADQRAVDEAANDLIFHSSSIGKASA
ncbi:MAG: Eco57I restriction-modification methylase domain-containing protein [Planctomycetota bacterium]